jgi:hypothetical protein
MLRRVDKERSKPDEEMEASRLWHGRVCKAGPPHLRIPRIDQRTASKEKFARRSGEHPRPFHTVRGGPQNSGVLTCPPESVQIGIRSGRRAASASRPSDHGKIRWLFWWLFVGDFCACPCNDVPSSSDAKSLISRAIASNLQYHTPPCNGSVF